MNFYRQKLCTSFYWVPLPKICYQLDCYFYDLLSYFVVRVVTSFYVQRSGVDIKDC